MKNNKLCFIFFCGSGVVRDPVSFCLTIEVSCEWLQMEGAYLSWKKNHGEVLKENGFVFAKCQ